MKDKKKKVPGGSAHDSTGGAHHPCGMNRLHFLKMIGAVSVTSLMTQLGCDDADASIDTTGDTTGEISGDETDKTIVDNTEDTAIKLSLPDAPEGVASVGIARDSAAESAVRAAVDLAGGLADIKWGQSVVIKINCMCPDPASFGYAHVCTRPEVLRAVVRLVKERTSASRIAVAEAAPMSFSSRQFAYANGILHVCNDEDVEFIALEKGSYSYVTSDYFKYIDYRFRVPTSFLNGTFDHMITVPILKNHEVIPNTDVDFTCCMKLHVGTMHPYDRVLVKDFNYMDLLKGKITVNDCGIHHQYMGEACAELNLTVPKITMNIVDAIKPIVSNGPGVPGYKHADADLIIASKDRVACDSLAFAVLKYYALEKGIDKPYVTRSVWEQSQIKRAQELNLGRTKNNIAIKNSNVDNIDGILAQWA